MKATDGDIRFAQMVTDTLRRSKIKTKGDLYLSCKNAERNLTARAYQAAANYMTKTGKWRMPDERQLERIRAKAWAPLHSALGLPT